MVRKPEAPGSNKHHPISATITLYQKFMANKRLLAYLALAATWLIIATEWLERDGGFRVLFPASTPMERCVAGGGQRRLFHDRHWGGQLSAGCGVVFPGQL